MIDASKFLKKDDERFDIAVFVFNSETGNLVRIDVKPSGRYRTDEFIGKLSRLFRDSVWGSIRHLCRLDGQPIFYDGRRASIPTQGGKGDRPA